MLGNPTLVRAEIDRRLTELRADHVADVQRDIAMKELARIRAGITRLIEAYQEQLISLDELRTRMPSLRQRETTVQAQLATLEAELLDAETYVTLAESLEGFLAKLEDAAQSLGLTDRQRVLRLVVKEVQVGLDSIVIRHSIPLPDNHAAPGYLLRPGHRDHRFRRSRSAIPSLIARPSQRALRKGGVIPSGIPGNGRMIVRLAEALQRERTLTGDRVREIIG